MIILEVFLQFAPLYLLSSLLLVIFVLVFRFSCRSLLQISSETQNNINVNFFFSSLQVETNVWWVDCRILAYPDGFLIKHPMPVFVSHFAAINPIYWEKNPPVSCPGWVERGTGGRGKNDQQSMMVEDRNGGCQCLRSRAEAKDKVFHYLL